MTIKDMEQGHNSLRNGGLTPRLDGDGLQTCREVL